MGVLETLTKLVVGASRLGDHLLSRKVSGIIVASLAFGCGAGLAHSLKREATPPGPAVISRAPAAPARAEVSMSDTPAAGGGASDRGGCSKR